MGNLRFSSLLLLSGLLAGCGGGGGGSAAVAAGEKSPKLISKTVAIAEEHQITRLGKGAEINTTVEIGTTPKSLYLLFTNGSKASSGSVTVTHSARVVSAMKPQRALTASLASAQPHILHAPGYVQAFNAHLYKNSMQALKQKKIRPESLLKSAKSVGDGDTFYMDQFGSSKTDATLRKIVSSVSTAFGNKRLYVWVANDSFGNGCPKRKCVTQEQVDALAKTFLQDGKDNDIYDWVTNIFGEEWGSAAASKHNTLIGESNEITILLTDIDDDDSPYGGVVGYFYGKDNFNAAAVSGSNERIMFYVDAVMFANEEDNGFWQKEIYATLAHEFQHMIHFYQKTVKLNVEDDTWINEMLSETTEDLIATKIEHTGPRNVAYTDGSAGDPDNRWGRYPFFNQDINDFSLTAWSNTLSDYSKVSAFGAFLIRNYGGAKVLHDILYNGYGDEQAVLYAVHQTANGRGKGFGDLLREWGVGVLLSDSDNLATDKPVYNRGDFLDDTYNKSTYEIGSINFFNYTPQPAIATDAGSVAKHGNYYYQVGENLTGNVTISMKLDPAIEATLITK